MQEFMQEIIIDEEFKRILPPLDEQTFAWLEANILEYGCREPLVLWNGILIDGHNRYNILKKHELPIRTVDMEFDSRDKVLIWIISTQVARRNLAPLQLSFYRGLHYSADKRVQGTNNQFVQGSEKVHFEPFHSGTAARLADEYNVSRSTIKRDAVVANAINAIGEVSPDVKMDILSGKAHISRRQLQELSSGTGEDVVSVVEKIKEGTLERRRSGAGEVRDGEVGEVRGSDVGDANSGEATDIGELRPWEMQFSKMTDEFRSVLRGHARVDDTDSVRLALREYIGMLEELYRSI